MLSIIGSRMPMPERHAEKINKGLILLDFAGAITLLALGALAFTGHGGATINALNANNGGLVMMAGGLVTLVALHLDKQSESSYGGRIQHVDIESYNSYS